MRLVRSAAGVGRIEGGAVVPVAGTITDLALRATREPGWVAPAAGDATPIAGLELLAPIDAPPSFRDFYAFERHVATARRRRGLEMDPIWYRQPVFYFSNPAVLLGPGQPVRRPPRCAQLDYELELAWVVGDGAGTVVGYTVMNDWSARDLQREEMSLSLGPAKGKDFATSLGPCLVTADELDPERDGAAMQARVNGRLYSDADFAECYWSIEEMTSYAGESTRLRPGDLFGSGTCGSGCILELSLVSGSEAFPWLEPGDDVELSIGGIGTLSSSVSGEAAGEAWCQDGNRRRPRL